MSSEVLTGFIPAGGQGSRLYPHTNEIPKPLLPMGDDGHLLIDAALEVTTNHCDHVWVSTDFEAESVEAYISEFPGVFPLRDRRTVGNAGSLLEHFSEISQEDPKGDFLFIPADHVYAGFDVGAFWDAHRESNAEVTFMVVPPKNYGVYAIVNKSDEVVKITDRPLSQSLSTTGTYIFKNTYLLELLTAICESGWDGEGINITFDLAHSAINQVRVAAYRMSESGYWDDAGTLERYHQNNMRLSNNRNIISPAAEIDHSVILRRCVVIGSATVQGERVIDNAIISGFSDGSTKVSRLE